MWPRVDVLGPNMWAIHCDKGVIVDTIPNLCEPFEIQYKQSTGQCILDYNFDTLYELEHPQVVRHLFELDGDPLMIATTVTGLVADPSARIMCVAVCTQVDARQRDLQLSYESIPAGRSVTVIVKPNLPHQSQVDFTTVMALPNQGKHLREHLMITIKHL